MSADRAEDRWAEVERLYQGAIECAPDARGAFLDAAASDPAVRSEVEALLRHDAEAGDFLERPAIEEAAAGLVMGQGPLEAGVRLGDYEVAGLIGSGGMGDVYRARDLRLERDVALKVMPRGAATDESDGIRFENEARAASGLAHPNVVTIYGVGGQSGAAYIAMELVQGTTLRERLEAGRPSISTALDWAAQIADALAAAHAAGVVHRDLKPDNIMVTADGRIKVLDFGIAKRAHLRERESAAGTIRGTAGYMSPEQAGGQPVDHTTDQFSFGAVCYEMLTGRRAFQRDTLAETIDAVKHTEPAAIHRVNADVPAGVRSLVERCLAKSAADRWASTNDLAAELRRLRDRWQRDETLRQGRRRAWWMAGAATVTAAAGLSAWQAWPTGPRALSLAVLPFDNADADAAIDYLCDGLPEAVMRLLSFVPGLEVRARSASFNFKRVAVDPRDAGRRLGVTAVLAGSVTARDGRLRVSARLVDVASGANLWGDDYSRPASDALALQYDLARAIVAEGVSRPLDAEAKRRFERPVTNSAEAYDSYLRALYFHRLGEEPYYRSARSLLERSVGLDPAFALAQVSLAGTFSVMTIDGFERPTDSWPSSNRCVRRALAIDPALPEAHAEQASAWFFFDHDWYGAESEWKLSLQGQASPSMPDLLGASAIKLWALGRNAEALDLARRARALDPLTPRFAIQEADLLLYAGRPREAAAVYEALIEGEPGEAGAHLGLAQAYHDQGDVARAVAARRRGYELVGLTLPVAGDGEAAYAALDRAAAEAELARLAMRAAQGLYVSPLDSARERARLNDARGAIDDLDAAFDEASPGLVFLRVDPAWRSLREVKRFQDAVDAMNLP